NAPVQSHLFCHPDGALAILQSQPTVETVGYFRSSLSGLCDPCSSVVQHVRDPQHFRMQCCGGNIQPSPCWRTCCDSQSRAPFENPKRDSVPEPRVAPPSRRPWLRRRLRRGESGAMARREGGRHELPWVISEKHPQ